VPDRTRWSRLVATVVYLVALGNAGPVAAESGGGSPPLGALITSAATSAGIPAELLAAVVWVESRRWPWAVNVGGRPIYPRSRDEAAAWLRAAGGRADIGLAQVHYPVWGPVFGLRPEDLLDPWINLQVAALILRHAMNEEPGSWGGVGRYHSATPWRKWWYARHVATVFRGLRTPMPPSDRAPAP
jgi:soluble lytic murein transglycosylase-like protein